MTTTVKTSCSRQSKRGDLLHTLTTVCLYAALAASISAPCISNSFAQVATRPNVVLIMTDDQGYGDLGIHGNPIVRTPNIDAMAKNSAVLPNFYVSPVCTPT